MTLRAHAALAVCVLLLACTLGARLPGAVHDALWQDEVGTQRVISKPTLGAALDEIVRRESTPPAFYVIARAADRAAVGLTPDSRARTVRAVSIAFGLGTTALTFALAWELLPLWAAALAGLLASFASVLVVHGSELRAYSLLALACAAFALLLQRAAARPSLRLLTLLSGVVALGSLTHYFFLFTFAAGVVWLLVSGGRRLLLGRIGLALVVGLIPLAVWWSPFWLRQYEHGIYGTGRPFTLARFLDFLPSIFAPQPVVLDMGIVIHAGVTLTVLVPAVLLLRRTEGRLCALFALGPFLGASALAWATEERIFNTRNLIGVAPFAAITLAWACASLPWRRLTVASGALVGTLVVAGFAYGESRLGRTPYDRIADELIGQGLRRDEPLLWLGRYHGIVAVGWYLTLDGPADAWPRVVVSTPTEDSCNALGAVVGTETGRQWLERHRDAVLAQTSIPSFGNVAQGGRKPDLIVARLRWSAGILDRPPWTTNWFLFHRAGTRSPCLAP